MDFLSEVRDAIKAAVGSDHRPVVVYSAVWPFFRELRQADHAAVESLLEVLLSVVGQRTLLMPTFSSGFANGVCNLDVERSLTGVLSETFRRQAGTRRTLSAYFSFAVSGEDADAVAALQPVHAWGPDSVYEWMETRDACFLMLGTHPTQCSYLHRAEWLARELVSYRFDKTFQGQLVRDGRRISITETLYVRQMEPPVVNDFTVLAPVLSRAGMVTTSPRGVPIAAYHAKAALAETVAGLRRDPLLLVKNRHDYEGRNQ